MGIVLIGLENASANFQKLYFVRSIFIKVSRAENTNYDRFNLSIPKRNSYKAIETWQRHSLVPGELF